MKSPLCSSLFKITSLIVLLTFYFGSSTYGQARGRDVLSPGPVRPGNLDYRTELPRGYLKVYSATDEFNDGAYYPYSSSAIYYNAVRLYKCDEDTIPRTGAVVICEGELPSVAYTVVVRQSEG